MLDTQKGCGSAELLFVPARNVCGASTERASNRLLYAHRYRKDGRGGATQRHARPADGPTGPRQQRARRPVRSAIELVATTTLPDETLSPPWQRSGCRPIVAVSARPRRRAGSTWGRMAPGNRSARGLENPGERFRNCRNAEAPVHPWSPIGIPPSLTS
jgi:hypothetical protein